MRLRTRILLALVVLHLPLSIIGLVGWIPPIDDLQYALVVVLGVWLFFLSLLFFLTRKLRQVYVDYILGFVIVGVFGVFPIAAGVLWINQWVVRDQQISQMEVVTRFHAPRSDNIYLHLWDKQHLRSQAVALDGPASTAQPGDRIALTMNKGLFGITYVKHAHIVR